MADVNVEGRTRRQQLLRDRQQKYPTYQPPSSGGGQKDTKGPLGFIHATLAMFGLAPGAGIPFDLLDAGIYSVEALFAKDAESRKSALIGGGLSATAAIPFIGWGSRAGQAGKVLKESSEQVIKLTEDANRIVREAVEAEAKGGSQKVLKQYNQKFKDLVENKIPKAQQEFTENLDSVDAAIKGAGGVKRTTGKAVREAQGATSGMSTKQALKYQDEMSSLIKDIKEEVPKDIKKFKSNVRGPAVEGVTDAGKKLKEAKSDFGVAEFRARDTTQAIDDYVEAGGSTNLAPFRDPKRLTGQMIPQGPGKTVSRGDVPMQLSDRSRAALNRRQGGSEQLITSGSRRTGNELVPRGARTPGNQIVPSGPRVERPVSGRVVEPYSGRSLMRGTKGAGALAGGIGAGYISKSIYEASKQGPPMEFGMGKSSFTPPNTTPAGHSEMLRQSGPPTKLEPKITTQPQGHTKMMGAQEQPESSVSNIPVGEMKKRLPQLTQEEPQDKTSSMLKDASGEGKGFPSGTLPDFTPEEIRRSKEINKIESSIRERAKVLAARRAEGTGSGSGLRTPNQVLNRIEEGQKSIRDSSIPRDEAFKNARQRMDVVRTAQRGRDQYYKDIVKDPRGLRVPTAGGGTRTIPRRTNPYMVGPTPDSGGFETEADAERIRTIDGGKYASILEEDKKKRRNRTKLVGRRR